MPCDNLRSVLVPVDMGSGSCIVYKLRQTQAMNYTLQQLKDRVNTLIEQQGETAYCAAWIYTKEDCHLKDENGEFDYDNVVEDAEVLERIFDDVGNIDYIYQVIQECVDEVTEEQLMQQQQELV